MSFKRGNIPCAVLFFVFSVSSLLSASPLIIDAPFEGKALGTYIDYRADESGTLDIEHVSRRGDEHLWNASKRDNLGFGFTDTVYWIRFTIENRTGGAVELFLEQDYPLVDSIQLFIPERGSFRMIDTGDMKPFAERPYANRNFIFPLKLGKKSNTTCYMRFRTGGSMNIILAAWSPESFQKKAFTEYIVLSMFYGIILIISISNLFIYFIIRRTEYLYFILFSIFSLLLMMALNGTAYQYLWPGYPAWANRSVPVFNSLITLFLILFSIELVDLRRYGKVMSRIAFIGPLLVIPGIIVSMTVPVNYATMLASLAWGLAVIIVFVIGAILIIIDRNRQAVFGLIAGSALTIAGLAYLLKSFGVLPTNFVTDWSSHIGLVLMLTIFSAALADRVNIMGRHIQQAESKYRNLVESSNDIIFSLDDDLKFLSVNGAMQKHLGYSEKEVIGRNFLDIIQEAGRERNEMSRMLVEEHINEIRQTGKEVMFRTDFMSQYTHEPTEFLVKLEYQVAEGQKEKFLGKASLLTDDILLQYMEYERHAYCADSYLSNAELLSQRLTRNLVKYFDKSTVSLLRISLREIIINAIEHGNLNISFEEKTALKDDSTYRNYLKRIHDRQNDPRYRDRKIRLEYRLTDGKVEYLIADEGDGFDHNVMLDAYAETAHRDGLSHGRGLHMAKNVFDEVKFNKKGNRVLLVKYFKNR